VVFGSVVGTALEWYDFFIYGTAAALVFGDLFFPSSDPAVGSLVAFATFGVGFVFRPLGGMLFGHIGDRIGRRATLVLTTLIRGVSTGLIGLLPTHESIGIWAAVLLVLLRVVQGLGAGPSSVAPRRCSPSMPPGHGAASSPRSRRAASRSGCCSGPWSSWWSASSPTRP
jgi:MHS family shikimate/dehydroshikimate transporter-like MFS transporter